jgi:hypothetical protein
MKTPEDEAFDELAQRQGAWGGGFPAKRKMAADKFIAAEERKVGERYGYVPKLHPSEWMNDHNEDNLDMVAQPFLPAQEPVTHLWECLGRWSAYLVENGKQADCAPPSWLVDAINKATTPPPPVQEPIGSLSVRYFRGSKAMTNTDFDYTGDLPEGDYELYTAPPQREWVGLTSDEVNNFAAGCHLGKSVQGAIYEAEAALRSKNNGT